jgi:hypothetical protein
MCWPILWSCNYFKALYNPNWQWYKCKCIRSVARVWRFRRINSRKKMKFETYWRCQWCHHCVQQTTEQVASLSSYYSHKCCSRKFVRKKLDLTNMDWTSIHYQNSHTKMFNVATYKVSGRSNACRKCLPWIALKHIKLNRMKNSDHLLVAHNAIPKVLTFKNHPLPLNHKVQQTNAAHNWSLQSWKLKWDMCTKYQRPCLRHMLHLDLVLLFSLIRSPFLFGCYIKSLVQL